MYSLPVPVKAVIEQEIEDGLMLLLESGDYIIINSIGYVIWRLIKEVGSFDILIDKLQLLPGVPVKDVCREQVKEFLNHLVNEGYLKDMI